MQYLSLTGISYLPVYSMDMPTRKQFTDKVIFNAHTVGETQHYSSPRDRWSVKDSIYAVHCTMCTD